jgi:hypothetical protein
MILTVVLAIPCFGGNLDKKFPSLEGLVKWGCAVNGPIWQMDHNHPSGRNTKVWTVDFHASHKDILSGETKKDWKLFYGYRKSRKKGLDDCEKFMQRMEKHRRRTK